MLTQENKNQALPNGTNLDDRYEIIRVLGVGGFGITYEAVNKRIHLHVAVKELFVRAYMRRMDDGITVTAGAGYENERDLPDRKIKKDREERLQHDRKSFLREARIVGTFEDEPGIVHVLDYFEANGTAYIVMEFLDGMTLREYQMQRGIFQPDDIFEKMLPVMETLEKIHKAGVLHRDISPDNIMVMKDGSLRLMDFGAASVRNLGEQDENHTQAAEERQVKDGYAPPEQYGIRKDSPEQDPVSEGPWTDVYALAATIYTCMTGIVPPPALMRSAGETIKRPSEIGIRIRPRMEQILLKAMNLRPADRFQNISEFHDSILATLPASRRKKKRKRRRTLLFFLQIAAAAAIVAGFFYARGHEAEIRFHGKPTETIRISAPEGMLAKDFFQNEKILRKRLDVFLGKNQYIWKEAGEETAITFPSEKLDGQDPETAVEQYLTASRKVELSVQYHLRDEDGNEKGYTSADTNIILKKGDLVSLKKKEDGQEGVYQGRLSENLQKKAGKIKGDLFLMDADAQNLILSYDRTSVNVSEGTAEADLSDVPEVFRKLVLYELTQDPMSDDLVCDEQRSVSWQDPEGNPEAGESEQSAASIRRDPVVLRYRAGDKNFSAGKRLGCETVLRQRLDAIGKPYAVGSDPDDESIFYIKMNREDILSSEAELLPCRGLFTNSGDGCETQYVSWLETELSNLQSDGDEETVSRLRHLLNGMKRQEMPAELYLDEVLESRGDTHTGRRTTLTKGEFSCWKMFEQLEENGRSLGADILMQREYLQSPDSTVLRLTFSDLDEDHLAEETVSAVKQIISGVSMEDWTRDTGALQILCSDGEELSTSLYVNFRRQYTGYQDGAAVMSEPSLSVLVDSWEQNEMLDAIQKSLAQDHFWDGKVGTVKENTYYELLKSQD